MKKKFVSLALASIMLVSASATSSAMNVNAATQICAPGTHQLSIVKMERAICRGGNLANIFTYVCRVCNITTTECHCHG